MKNNLNREYLKRLVGEHQLDDLMEELFNLLSNYLSIKKDRSVSEIYDTLILISGKHKSLKHENLLGIIDAKDFSLESNKVGYSLLSLVNSLPDTLFEHYEENTKKIETTREKIKKINAQSHFTYDIFLSFSSKDINEAKTLAEGLRGYGLRVFISDEVLKSNVGTSFFEKIDFALKNSKDFILLVTPNAMDSEWVKTEYETFYNEYFIPDKAARKFIVFKGNDFDQTTVPSLFKRLQFAGSLQEILQSYLEHEETIKKVEDEKRQKEQAELEQQAIEEKRKKQQTEQERLEKEKIAARQRHQEELEKEALEEKRLENEKVAARQRHQEELEKEALAEKRLRDANKNALAERLENEPKPKPKNIKKAEKDEKITPPNAYNNNPGATYGDSSPATQPQSIYAPQSADNKWRYAAIGLGAAMVLWLGYCLFAPKNNGNPISQEPPVTTTQTIPETNIFSDTSKIQTPTVSPTGTVDEYGASDEQKKFAFKNIKIFEKTGDPKTVAISKNGKWLAAYFSKNHNNGSKDFKLRVWRISDFKLMQEIPMEDPYSDYDTYSGAVLCFDGQESKLLYNNGKKLCVMALSGNWDKSVIMDNVELYGGAFHPTNSDIIYLCGRNKAYSYRISSYNEVAKVPITDSANSYGRTHTCVTDKGVFFSRIFTNKLVKFSFADHSGKTIETNFGKSAFEDLYPFAISPNEQYIAVKKDNTACLYNYRDFLKDPNSKWLGGYKHTNSIFHIQFTDNEHVVSSSSDRSVGAMEVPSGKALAKYTDPKLSYSEYISVAPGARKMAVGTLNGRLFLLEY